MIAENAATAGANQLEEGSVTTPPSSVPRCGRWRNWVNLGAYAANFVITFVSITGAFGETNTDLSAKYQTLVTPAGWAFSIWGVIFTWEGIWAVAQMLPRYSESKPVNSVTPWWWAACLMQCAWTLAFAQESIPFALCCMLGILVSLLGAVLSLDRQSLSLEWYLVLRAPFAMHLGWIVVASALNVNVVADAEKAAPGALLGCAVASLVVIFAIATAFTCGAKTPEPLVGFVVAWALLALGLNLQEPTDLLNPSRFNPFAWDRVVLDGLSSASLAASAGALALALTSILLRLRRAALEQ